MSESASRRPRRALPPGVTTDLARPRPGPARPGGGRHQGQEDGPQAQRRVRGRCHLIARQLRTPAADWRKNEPARHELLCNGPRLEGLVDEPRPVLQLQERRRFEASELLPLESQKLGQPPQAIGDLCLLLEARVRDADEGRVG